MHVDNDRVEGLFYELTFLLFHYCSKFLSCLSVNEADLTKKSRGNTMTTGLN